MPYPRHFWNRDYALLEVDKDTREYDQKRIFSIIIGADDPMMLEEESAIQFAKTIAAEKLDAWILECGDIRVHGQNFLAEREFRLVENRKLFLVRSKPGDVERLPEFLSQGFVAIGWTETGDLSFADKDDIRDVLRQVGFEGISLGQNCRIVNDFVNTMKYDDVVLVPDANFVHVGMVGDYYWREEYKKQRMAHYRPVKWLGKVERIRLNESVQK